MDILFNQTHIYIADDSIDNVRDKMQSIIAKKWFDFSSNIAGRISSNGNYVFTHKWSFVIFHWIETSPAYLNVKLIKENDRTKVVTFLRPNSLFVILFYLLTILFLCELFGINTFLKESKVLSLLFLLGFTLIIFGLIKLYTTGLENRFKRILQL